MTVYLVTFFGDRFELDDALRKDLEAHVSGLAGRSRGDAPRAEPAAHPTGALGATLLQKVARGELTPVACRAKANLSRDAFDGLASGRPISAQTALALAVALELAPSRMREMLGQAGVAPCKEEEVASYCHVHTSWHGLHGEFADRGNSILGESAWKGLGGRWWYGALENGLFKKAVVQRFFIGRRRRPTANLITDKALDWGVESGF